MKEGYQLNPDEKYREKILNAIVNNGGYCPCSIKKNTDTKCPCKKFNESTDGAPCLCRLFTPIQWRDFNAESNK